MKLESFDLHGDSFPTVELARSEGMKAQLQVILSAMAIYELDRKTLTGMRSHKSGGYCDVCPTHTPIARFFTFLQNPETDILVCTFPSVEVIAATG